MTNEIRIKIMDIINNGDNSSSKTVNDNWLITEKSGFLFRSFSAKRKLPESAMNYVLARQLSMSNIDS